MTQPGQIVYLQGQPIGISMSSNYAASGILTYYQPSFSWGGACSGIVMTGILSQEAIDKLNEEPDEEGICLECNWHGPIFEPCDKHVKRALDG